jgi:hypothetical protein
MDTVPFALTRYHTFSLCFVVTVVPSHCLLTNHNSKLQVIAASRRRIPVNVNVRVAIKHPIWLEERPSSLISQHLIATQYCQEPPTQTLATTYQVLPLNPSLSISIHN